MNSRRKKETVATTQDDDLQKTLVACLGSVCPQQHSGDVAHSGSGEGLVNPSRRFRFRLRIARKALVPKDAEAKAVYEFLTTVVAGAVADAARVGDHLDHLAEHLRAIGCTGREDVESYFRFANRTLASLYLEAVKAHPSPSELTKFALRYALDARYPIEGGVQRFLIRRVNDVWEICEYPSLAMQTPAIPIPGRTIKNIFAVRIFDYLQHEPPKIFELMRLIESLLGGVPSTADALGGSGGGGPQRKIEVNLEKSIVWLDGEDFHVKAAQAYFVQAVVSAEGMWISSTEIAKSERNATTMIGPRPDRVRAGLPKPIRDLIEANGGRGFRLRVA